MRCINQSYWLLIVDCTFDALVFREVSVAQAKQAKLMLLGGRQTQLQLGTAVSDPSCHHK